MSQGPPQGPPAGPPEGWQPPQQPQWGPPGQQPQWGAQPTTTQQPPPSRRKLSGCLTAVVIFVGILVVAGIIGALTGEDAPQSTPSATNTPAQPTSVPTTTPATTKLKPVPVEEQVKAAVLKAVGDSNRDLEPLPEFSAPRGEYIVLTWTIDENLTEGLTKDSARLDGMRILKAIKEVEARTGNHYTGAFLKGTYLLVDKYGNETEEIVVRAGYDKATINRINFENVSFKDIFDLADRGSVHPAFQY